MANNTAAATAANAFRRRKATIERALDRGQITRAEYNEEMAKATKQFESASGKATKIAERGANVANSRAAAKPASNLSKIKTGAKTVVGKAKGAGVVGAVLTGVQVGVAADQAIKGYLDKKTGRNAPTAGKLSQADIAKIRKQGVSKDNMFSDVVRKSTQSKPKPSTGKGGTSSTPRPSGGSTARPGTYTVRSGDSLSKIASKNGTTVQAILKANPTIASRRKAGKVDIFSGSKVRIPKGK